MVNEDLYPYSGDNTTVADVEDMPWAPAVLADKGLFLLLLYGKAISCMDEAMLLIELLPLLLHLVSLLFLQ